MFTDRRPCSCQGSNPDCFRCNGTGMIPDQAKDSNSHSEIYSLAEMLNIKRNKNNSNNEITANDPRQNVKTIIKSNISNEAVPKLTNCPLCSVSFSSKDLLNHIVTYHKKRFQSNAYNIEYFPNFLRLEIEKYNIESNSMLVTCDLCGITLSRARLESHKNNIHKDILKSMNPPDKKTIVADKRTKRSPAITPKKTIDKKTDRNTISSDKINSSVRLETVSNRLDGTYGKHQIRDGGRYGSHPSHDNYDDESGA